MFCPDDTIVAIATPPGRGGIGVVRISGSTAGRVAASVAIRCEPLEPRRATLTELRANGEAIDVPDDVGVINIGDPDGLADGEGFAGSRYGAEPGTSYLLRPDGYVAARFRHPSRAAIEAAVTRASGLN